MITAGGGAAAAAGPEMLHLLEEEQVDEEHFVSSYEKAHPLEVPKALLEVRGVASGHQDSSFDDKRPFSTLQRLET